HYMGFIYYGAIIIGIIIFNREHKFFKKAIFISVLIPLVSYIPWIPYAFEDSLTGAHGYAGGQLSLINLAYWSFTFFLAPVPSYINDPYVLNMIILTFLINIPLMILSLISLIGFLVVYKNIKSFEHKNILNFILLLTLFLFGGSIAAGFLFENSFTAKNLIGGLSLVYVLEGFGLYYLFIEKEFIHLNLKNGILKKLQLIQSRKLINSLLISLLLVNLMIYPLFRNYYLQKPDWDGCFSTLKKEFEKNDIIIMAYPGRGYSDVMEYYSKKNDFDLEDNFYTILYEEDEIEDFFEEVHEENITRIWIITFWEKIRDPNDKTESTLIDEYDLDKIDKYKFRLDITLTLYELP
ncbi:MAG: hypothetical protein ACFFAO_09200, partial [Candidatus Hermodarchaeota archaeon]